MSEHPPIRDADSTPSTWAWNDEAQGYLCGSASPRDWAGRPAGVSRETVIALFGRSQRNPRAAA